MRVATVVSDTIQATRNALSNQRRQLLPQAGASEELMNKLVTIQVSEQVMRQATRIAFNTEQSVENVLSDLLESSVSEPPVQFLPDNEVLALTALNFSPKEQESFSDLLYRNREGLLDAEGHKELDRLMRIYERGLLRKAQALEEAVKRGLMEPLKP